MEVPKFALKLGSGRWIGTAYVLDKCPLCGSINSIMFTGKGMWACRECKKGGNDLNSFRELMKANPVMAQFVDSIVEPEAPATMIVVGDYISPYKDKIIGTGFGSIDQMLGGLKEGAMTIITGKRGEGKSTLLGQLSLNAIDEGHKVGFYSGELSAGRFQSWLFSQAAGARNMQSFIDPFGAERWAVRADVEKKIRKWLGEALVLYDNTKMKSSERHSIMKAFSQSRAFFGCDLFVIDNLMTAKQDTDDDSDALRAQANFANEALNFASENSVHVILVAHPRKGDNGDINDSVSGLGDITNMATNVIQIKKASEKEQKEMNCDAIITVAKNREYGDTGFSRFNFDKTSKRFVPVNGTCVSSYGWEKGVRS